VRINREAQAEEALKKFAQAVFDNLRLSSPQAYDAVGSFRVRFGETAVYSFIVVNGLNLGVIVLQYDDEPIPENVHVNMRPNWQDYVARQTLPKT
jgi:hypothetical protein